MERRRTSVWRRKLLFGLVWLLFAVAGAKVTPTHSSSSLTVSSVHRYYICPEGATAKLECNQKITNSHSHQELKDRWLFTPHSDQHCQNGATPRNVGHKGHVQNLGVEMSHTNEKMWVTLKNVTFKDQGRYCCLALDVKMDHNHPTVQQSAHSHVILQVTPKRDKPANCTFLDLTPPPASVPVALALAACILALLSLPLILVLVYKQRENSRSNRRGQELVRMDSEAQGHENPVFLGGSPQAKTRTVSQILTRQPSETSRHLLSDPGTPLSPPAHGDVFFPSEDIIPEDPDLVQI